MKCRRVLVVGLLVAVVDLVAEVVLEARRIRTFVHAIGGPNA